MVYAGWIVAGILLVWYLKSQKFCQEKRMNLNSYIVYLLMEDSLRDNHKEKFGEWIGSSDAKDATDLAIKASNTIDNMAETLSKDGNSLLASNSMLWNSEYAEEIRKNYKGS